MRLKPHISHALMLAGPLLLLAACGDEAEPVDRSEEVGGQVSGDVLGGSVSDEMLPLEELQSQSPPAPRASGSAARSNDSADEADEPAETETQEAEAAPAAPALEVPAEPAPDDAE